MKNSAKNTIPTVGIVGMGFMGKMHYDVYTRTGIAQVKAFCDVDARKRAGDWSSIVGNISSQGGGGDATGIKAYARLEDLLMDPSISVIDITLPTPLHAEAVIKALNAGKDVICEKPIARTVKEAASMIEAARKNGRNLFIGQCIRFWPSYASAAAILKKKSYGKLYSAVFQRHSSTPLSSHQNWLQDPEQSGACALDLHIHDSDFIQFALGLPESVQSHGTGFSKGRLDHISTTYIYPNGPLVQATGSWEYAKDFPFSMSFVLNFEKGTIKGDAGSLTYYPRRGGVENLPLQAADGYELELRHFIECIVKQRESKIVPPESALESLRLVEAETKSALTGRPVSIKAKAAK